MSWMNSKLFKRWISYPFAMWIPNSVLLIFDSARCYTLRDTLDFLNAKKILYCVIPGGGTPYLQPAEFMWFKPVKDSIRNWIREWIFRQEVNRNSAGRLKLPLANNMAQWLNRAWDLLVQNISKKFQIQITFFPWKFNNQYRSRHLRTFS